MVRARPVHQAILPLAIREDIFGGMAPGCQLADPVGRRQGRGLCSRPYERVNAVKAVVPQLLTLVGVIIGVLASYLTTSAGEKTRWRRAQNVRWDESRMRAYAEYASAVKRWAYI